LARYDAIPLEADILKWYLARGVRVAGCLVLVNRDGTPRTTRPVVLDESGKPVKLARYVFERFHGTTELQILHHCDNPPCFDPEHLFAGTISDNMRDMMAKGRRYYRRGVEHAQAKLTAEQREAVRLRYAAGDVRQADLARDYSVSPAFISRIVRAGLSLASDGATEVTVLAAPEPDTVPSV